MEKNFSITPEAFNAIMAGLSELPWKIANRVMTDLRRQAQELNELGQVQVRESSSSDQGGDQSS